VAGRYTIQRAPKGVLDLFSMKGTGDLPTDLHPEITPIVDLSAYYLADLITAKQTTTSVVNLGGIWGPTAVVGVAPVPAGEIWLVYNFTVRTNTQLAAGEIYNNVKPAFFRNQFNTVQCLTDVGASAGGAAAGGFLYIGKQFDRPEILRPADTYGLVCDAPTAGAHQFYLELYVAVLRI
jgi:hypothetical protein